jgi:hypothetical protein
MGHLSDLHPLHLIRVSVLFPFLSRYSFQMTFLGVISAFTGSVFSVGTASMEAELHNSHFLSSLGVGL